MARPTAAALLLPGPAGLGLSSLSAPEPEAEPLQKISSNGEKSIGEQAAGEKAQAQGRARGRRTSGVDQAQRGGKWQEEKTTGVQAQAWGGPGGHMVGAGGRGGRDKH